jgi:hypothetical protein
LDEEDQSFFCPPGFELWLLRNAESSPPFQAQCVDQSSPNDGGGSDGGGGAELTQNGEQKAESGEYNITTNVS